MQFQQHLFISDVHLGAFSDEINQQIEEDLIKLVEYCIQHKIALYLLGDIFDYWMEYPDHAFVPNLGKKVLDVFETYNQSVTPALYITGNHDNWTFGHFRNRGFEVENDFKILTLQNKNFLLMHGDGVSSSKIDFPRKVFHRLLRNPNFVQAYQRILSPEVGLQTMKWFSSVSRLSRFKRKHSPKPLNTKVENLFNNHTFDFILSGHDHIGRKETFSNGVYINTGMFSKNRTAALFNNNDGLKLVNWKASENSFIPFTEQITN